MAEHRKAMLGEEVRRELSEIIRDSVKDPRIEGSMVSVTHVDCSKDMKYATVYLSVFGKSETNDVLPVFTQAAGFIRNELARKLNMRNTPELCFRADDSIKQGARINELLKQSERND